MTLVTATYSEAGVPEAAFAAEKGRGSPVSIAPGLDTESGIQ
jgi:hypothetical protein